MPKSLEHWEGLLTLAVDQRTRIVEKYFGSVACGIPHRPSMWRKVEGHWKRKSKSDCLTDLLLYEINRRKTWEYRVKVAKIDRRIAYIHERIAARRRVSIWDHVRAGVKKLAKESARCRDT